MTSHFGCARLLAGDMEGVQDGHHSELITSKTGAQTKCQASVKHDIFCTAKP